MERFLRFCVERRVTVSMLTATVLLFGLLAWFRLDREFMPNLQFPQLVVLTSYPNASSQEVENLVTKVVEEAAGTVRNVHRVHSTSREGISVVTVEFLWGTAMDVASLNLREKVDLAKGKLPRDAGEPRIERFNPFALPVITLTLAGNRSEQELLALARRPVAEMLEKTRGVAAVALTGGREREILVELDQAALAARGLPILEVGQAISRANVTYPAGSVKDKTFDYVVRVLGTFDKPSDLSGIAVAVDRTQLVTSQTPAQQRRRKQADGSHQTPQPIPLGSIAEVKDTLADRTSYSRFNGQPTISIAVLKQAEANVVRVAADVEERLPDIRSKLPNDVRMDVIYNQALFVKAGINGMVRDSLVGGLLAFGVLLIFLRSWRDAAVVSTAIPISIFTSLFLMYSRGMSLNTVTLAGLAIGIGHLVDGAIVVQENIARHRAMGKSRQDAAVQGSAEVFSAVATSLFTTVAVFLPLIFVSGVVGQVFRDLSWAVVFSQLTSLVVAFTVIPMLSAVRDAEAAPLALPETWTKRAAAWTAWYDRAITVALEQPLRVVGYAAAAFGAGLLVLLLIPRTLFPDVEGHELVLRLDMPVGTALDQTNRVTSTIESTLKAYSFVRHQSVTVGSIPQEGLQPLGAHQAQIVIGLKTGWRPSTDKIIGTLKKALTPGRLEGGRVLFLKQGGTFSFLGGQSAPVVVELKGHDLAALEAGARRLTSDLKSVTGLYNIRNSVSEPAPELQLAIKRDSLANMNLSVADLAETVLSAVRGKVVSKFREAGKEIDIRLRLREADRDNLDAMERLFVHSPLDVDVPVGAVANVRKAQGPSEILRYDQQRTVLVSADITGRSVDAVAGDIEPLLIPLRTPEMSATLTGESARMEESFSSLKVIVFLSVLFVFMIMAAQFESLWQPCLILVAIPLAVIGMGPALFLTRHPLSAMAGMGVVLLAGIVVNNGIVLIDFVNQSREAGMPLKEALRHGCHTRLRPILMTAITSMLGMLPLALGIGEGAEMQAPMAVVIVSGLFVSTLLTLVVLPALYVIAEAWVLPAEGRKVWLQWLKMRSETLWSR